MSTARATKRQHSPIQPEPAISKKLKSSPTTIAKSSVESVNGSHSVGDSVSNTKAVQPTDSYVPNPEETIKLGGSRRTHSLTLGDERRDILSKLRLIFWLSHFGDEYINKYCDNDEKIFIDTVKKSKLSELIALLETRVEEINEKLRTNV